MVKTENTEILKSKNKNEKLQHIHILTFVKDPIL